MEFPSLDYMSNMDLVLLLKDAREWNDKEFVEYILIELGKRQKTAPKASPVGT